MWPFVSDNDPCLRTFQIGGAFTLTQGLAFEQRWAVDIHSKSRLSKIQPLLCDR